jgi:hypothetical protein
VSLAASAAADGGAALRDRLEIEHLLDARQNDELAAAVLLPALRRRVGGDGVGVGEAGGEDLEARGLLHALAPCKKSLESRTGLRAHQATGAGWVS